ncbi:GDSL esterase/lipase At1g29670-like [Populus alba]|uniref:GDSL esterase/lipase At1g29670-like n=1 Tax=Populus alba TaxID=43335 RepID=UPI003CC732E3
MNAQLFNHNITVSRISKILGSEEVARKYLSQCIYVSDMGHNDYLNNYFLDDYNSSQLYTPEEFAQLLIETYETQLEVFTHTRQSCCDVEPGTVPCKSLSFPCSNRSDYVYWDGAHFTEAKSLGLWKKSI